MPQIAVEVVVILLLVLVNGVLAMSELALVSARPSRLRQWAKAGSAGARAALELARSPNRFLATIQVGITLVGILAGAFGGATLAGVLRERLINAGLSGRYASVVALILVVLAITYLSLIVGELVPKRLALQRPERVAALVARPMRVIAVGAAPVIWLLSVSTDAVLRLLRARASSEPAVTEDEIIDLLEQGARSGVIETDEHEMIVQVFELADRRVNELMTPRPHIVWLDVNEPVQVRHDKVVRSGHTSFPVCVNDLDNVLGIISLKDIWARAVEDGSAELSDLRPLLRQPLYVPESMPVLRLLQHFRHSGQHLALVVNEFGGVEGIITRGDAIDEIVGAAPVSVATDEPQIVARGDGSWLMDGTVSLIDAAEVLNRPHLVVQARGRYQTLGGFLMDQLGRIPRITDDVEWNGVRFEVVDMDGKRVDKVLVSRLDGADGDEPRSVDVG